MVLFWQTRNFLNYHPAGRFEDASLMVYNEHGGLGAVVPGAAQQREDGRKVFRSHRAAPTVGWCCAAPTILLPKPLVF